MRFVRPYGGVGLVGDTVSSRLLNSAHGDGVLVFRELSEMQERTDDIYTAHLLFAALLRLRVLENRVEELKAELARMEAVARVGY